MQEEKEAKFLRRLKNVAIYFGLGSATALRLLKTDFLTFPSASKIYIGYFLSTICIICVFLAGSWGLQKMQEWQKNFNDIKKKLMEADKEKPKED